MTTATKILTVDLEDWFHILDNEDTADPNSWLAFESRIEKNTERLLDLFDDCKVTATFFVLGYIARKHPDE